MAFREKMTRLWRNIILFGQALDHDPQSEIAKKISRLAATRNSDRAVLAIASRVDALATDLHALSERMDGVG